jgi:ABC-2 type transport system permease protein
MTTPPAARLYDVRYSRHTGLREPRRRSVLALARSSATRALGLKRTAGAKVWPFLLLAAAYLPVVAAVGVPLLAQGVSPDDVLTHQALLGLLTPVVVAFTATTLPSLLTRERRDRVLSLYFSTALSPAEYVLGKLLAAFALVAIVGLGPLLALWAGTIVTADAPLDQLGDDLGDLPGLVGAGLAVTVYFAAIGLLAGSLTAKRVFAVGGLLAALLVTPIVSGIASTESGDRDLLAIDLSLAAVRAGVTLLGGEPFEGDPPAAAWVWTVWAVVVVVSLLVLAWRYHDPEDA